MRLVFIAVLLSVLVGCTPKPNPISQLLIDYKDHTSDLWRDGNSLDLPQTAAPLDLIQSALESEGYHSVPTSSIKVQKLRLFTYPSNPNQSNALATWVKVNDDERVFFFKYDSSMWSYRAYKIPPRQQIATEPPKRI